MNKQNIKKAGVLLAGCLLVAALALLAVADLRAKYVTTVDLTGAVRFTADLAVDVTLWEHQAQRNPDGTYTLSATDNPTINTNTYVVMPGVDIPKDPTITITTKSAIPAYLYVEIVDNSPSSVTYTLDDKWERLTISGSDRTVYLYKYDEDYNFPAADAEGKITINIIKSQVITVGQAYDPAAAPSNFNIKFYAYLIQQQTGKDATAVFTEAYPNVP